MRIKLIMQVLPFIMGILLLGIEKRSPDSGKPKRSEEEILADLDRVGTFGM